MRNEHDNITIRSIIIGMILSGVFAALTVVLENRQGMLPSGNQLPLFPFIMLPILVVLVNPALRLVRIIKPLSLPELLIIFVMCMVSSGISTFGLTGQVVPIISGLFNREWNNDQTEWNRYVEPYINENFFISEPGTSELAKKYAAEIAILTPLQTKLSELARQRDRTTQEIQATNAKIRIQEARTYGVVPGAIPNLKEQIKALQDKNGNPNELKALQDKLAKMTANPNQEEEEKLNKLILKAEELTKKRETFVQPIEEQQKLVDAQEVIVTERRNILKEHDQKAFDKVQLFRRGLPPEKRSYPGIVFTMEDDASSYFRRLARLRNGRKAADKLKVAKINESQGDAILLEAIEALRPCSETKAILDDILVLTSTDTELAQQVANINAELAELNQKKRIATLDDMRRYEKQIDDLVSDRKDIQKDIEDNKKEIERKNKEIVICERVSKTMKDIEDLAGDWHTTSRKNEKVDEILAQFPDFDASLSRFFIGQVPWSHWIRPLIGWGIVVALTYLILLSFNLLIFRQWAYNEKLIFPLMELPEVIVGLDEGQTGPKDIIPAVYKNGLFWVGFAISASVMGWNVLCRTGVLPGLQQLDLNNSWTPFIRNSMFKALVPGARSMVFFIMIGFAFLIPKKVSFSLWFFHIFYMIILMILVALGYGSNESSFPSEWWYTLNFRTAIGGGALLVFASLVLWKCRSVILCVLKPDKLENVTTEERRELRSASAVFLIGSLALILILWKVMHVHIVYAVCGYAVIIVITIGLVRAVAEGGVLGFQAWTSPFHYIRHIFGFDKSFTAPHLFAPLMIYYAVLFLDIKTFIAPAMANALKIRDDAKMSRIKYHVGVVLGIGVACVVAIGVAIMMCYEPGHGADAMHSWFYSQFPKSLFTGIGDISKVPPAASWSIRGWLLFGALLMAALLYFRQTAFWLPHPIGLIMLVNPLMSAYWFSILLGWLAKSLVTKYANKHTYVRVRGLFIGLIIGELVIVLIAMIISLVMQKRLGIDLNRQ
jgi:hypothetical protein